MKLEKLIIGINWSNKHTLNLNSTIFLGVLKELFELSKLTPSMDEFLLNIIFCVQFN